MCVRPVARRRAAGRFRRREKACCGIRAAAWTRYGKNLPRFTGSERNKRRGEEKRSTRLAISAKGTSSGEPLRNDAGARAAAPNRSGGGGQSGHEHRLRPVPPVGSPRRPHAAPEGLPSRRVCEVLAPWRLRPFGKNAGRTRLDDGYIFLLTYCVRGVETECDKVIVALGKSEWLSKANSVDVPITETSFSSNIQNTL